jgi:hypothetical protein
MNGRIVMVVIVAMVVALLPSSAFGDAFPGAEEIQAIAWQYGPNGEPIHAAGAGIRVPDVGMPANADAYIAGKVGITNFNGHTYEGGTIKFCTSALVGTCSLRAYGSFQRPGFYQRNIDVSKVLGAVVYSYNVFRPDATNRPFYWVTTWMGAEGSTVVASSESPNNLAAVPNVFTGGASIGPWWGTIRVQGWTYTAGATAYNQCYAGRDDRNTISALTKGIPFTSRCAAGGAGVVVWEHSFAKRVAVPIVQK